MDIDTDHKKFHASVPVKPMAPRRLRQADEPWTTENSRPKRKIPPEETDNHQIEWKKILHKLSQPHGDNNIHTFQLSVRNMYARKAKSDWLWLSMIYYEQLWFSCTQRARGAIISFLWRWNWIKGFIRFRISMSVVARPICGFVI